MQSRDDRQESSGRPVPSPSFDDQATALLLKHFLPVLVILTPVAFRTPSFTLSTVLRFDTPPIGTFATVVVDVAMTWLLFFRSDCVIRLDLHVEDRSLGVSEILVADGGHTAFVGP
jgi:hypothetical protein